MNCMGATRSFCGMFSRMRGGGRGWQAAHYLVGLERLGYEAYYIEAHGCMPWAFLDNEVAEAEFIDGVMRRFDLGDRWAFHARNGSGAYYGMSEPQVKRLYRSAAAILNLHGGTVPTPEQSSTGRLVSWTPIPATCRSSCTKRLLSRSRFWDSTARFSLLPRTTAGTTANCRFPSDFLSSRRANRSSWISGIDKPAIGQSSQRLGTGSSFGGWWNLTARNISGASILSF